MEGAASRLVSREDHGPRASERSCRAGVLLVGPLSPPPLLGGVETGVALLLRTQLAESVPIRLFNTARRPATARRLYRKIAYQVAMWLRFLWAICSVRPRVVHVKTSSGVNFYQNAAYVALARLLCRRVILQIHSGHFPLFYARATWLGRRAIRIGLRLPHVLMALSPGWAERLRAISGREGVTVVPNAVDTRSFARATPCRGRFGIPPDRVALLFIGTGDDELDLRKGRAQLIDAVARLRRHHPSLLLVLAGPACERQDFSQALGPRGEGWLTLGTVEAEWKASLYRSVDVFVLPSEAENMPNTLLEAMAAGLPLVATRVGAVPEMIREGETGFLVAVGDVASLAERIERLLVDPALRHAMGARAAETARRDYDVTILESRLSDEYALARV